jgi:hypothetical protein
MRSAWHKWKRAVKRVLGYGHTPEAIQAKELEEMMTEEPEEQEEEQFKQQFDELLVNVRNEAIVQAANLYVFGRQALLLGIGMGALTIEAAQALLLRAVERGEIAEADAQATLARMQDERLAKASGAPESGPSLTDRAAVALADSASTILRALHLNGSRQ